MTETAEQKKAKAQEAAAAKAKAENEKSAAEAAKTASDKKAEERTAEEQKAAEATAVAKVEQEQYEANLKRNEEAAALAAKNDKKSEGKDIGFTDRTIAAKLQEASSPVAKANEREDYVLKQQLYQQAGLSAPEVLATSAKAETK